MENYNIKNTNRLLSIEKMIYLRAYFYKTCSHAKYSCISIIILSTITVFSFVVLNSFNQCVKVLIQLFL